MILWAAYGGFYGENLVRECSRISMRVSKENVAEFSMLKMNFDDCIRCIGG